VLHVSPHVLFPLQGSFPVFPRDPRTENLSRLPFLRQLSFLEPIDPIGAPIGENDLQPPVGPVGCGCLSSLIRFLFVSRGKILIGLRPFNRSCAPRHRCPSEDVFDPPPLLSRRAFFPYLIVFVRTRLARVSTRSCLPGFTNAFCASRELPPPPFFFRHLPPPRGTSCTVNWPPIFFQNRVFPSSASLFFCSPPYFRIRDGEPPPQVCPRRAPSEPAFPVFLFALPRHAGEVD